MSGFGERLRREREMRGVSLEEISDSTKIGTRSLKAIEDNEFDKLPGGIFNKGFVRAYSRFLGLDEDESVADFEAAWKEHQTAKGEPIEPVLAFDTKPDPPQAPPKTPWLAMISAVLLLTALAGLAWFFALKGQHARASNPAGATTGAAQPSNVLPVEIDPNAASVVPVAASPGTPSPQMGTKSDAAPSVTEESSSSRADKKPDEPLPNSDSSAPSAPANTSVAPIQLKVIAHEDSWYSVSADGKDLGQGILGAEKSRNIHAQKEVHLKLGNAGGVEISFNGKPVNLDGEPNQVRELTFTPEGLHQ